MPDPVPGAVLCVYAAAAVPNNDTLRFCLPIPMETVACGVGVITHHHWAVSTHADDRVQDHTHLASACRST